MVKNNKKTTEPESNENFILAKKTFLAEDCSERDIENILKKISRPGVDYTDLYFQCMKSESWTLEEGILKEGKFYIDQGVGIRVISGDKTGFAYSDEITLPALNKAAESACSIVQSGQQSVKPFSLKSRIPKKLLYPSRDPLNVWQDKDKVTFLETIDREARKQDPRISEVNVRLSGFYDIILIANSEGVFAADLRPLVRLNVTVFVDENKRRERGHMGGGSRSDYNYFLNDNLALNYAKEAARIALVNLEAIPAPAGTMPVVLASGWPGILLHEAIGHGLEGDFNRKGTSVFANKIGQKVASPLCTIVDHGNLTGNRRGSLNIDDEGTPTQETVLIEKGILCGYIQDKLNARLMHMKSTGNGRRETYAYVPLPRMTNTYMLEGQHDPQEIITSVKKGIYAVNFDGGEVDITSGKFVFTTSEAYLIENGKITAPVKNATLIGNGPEVLTKVSMVGNDLKLDNGIGTCGKDGQNIPVGIGQPTLKVDELTIGGTAR